MGSTILGMKYIKSLEKSIKSLEKNQLEVENGTFKVEVENNIDNITIDISHKNGDIFHLGEIFLAFWGAYRLKVQSYM